jgi:hypothetical protein
VEAGPPDGAVAARRHGGPLADRSAVKILTGVDDHSRFCVVACAMPRATARPVCEAFAQALRAYGVPLWWPRTDFGHGIEESLVLDTGEEGRKPRRGD